MPAFRKKKDKDKKISTESDGDYENPDDLKASSSKTKNTKETKKDKKKEKKEAKSNQAKKQPTKDKKTKKDKKDGKTKQSQPSTHATPVTTSHVPVLGTCNGGTGSNRFVNPEEQCEYEAVNDTECGEYEDTSNFGLPSPLQNQDSVKSSTKGDLSEIKTGIHHRTSTGAVGTRLSVKSAGSDHGIRQSITSAASSQHSNRSSGSQHVPDSRLSYMSFGSDGGDSVYCNEAGEDYINTRDEIHSLQRNSSNISNKMTLNMSVFKNHSTSEEMAPPVPPKGDLLSNRTSVTSQSSQKSDKRKSQDISTTAVSNGTNQRTSTNSSISDRTTCDQSPSHQHIQQVQSSAVQKSLKQSISIYQHMQMPKVVVDGTERLPSIFEYPWGIDVSHINSDIFITDIDRCKIIQFDTHGNKLNTFGSPGNGDVQFNAPHGVAFSSVKNMLAVSDTKNHRIQILKLDGTFIRSLGSEGKESGMLRRPFGIATCRDGVVYVVDHGNNRIQTWTLDGEHLCTFGSEGTGPGQFQQPHDVAVLPDGNIVVVDTNNNRLQILSDDGIFRYAIGHQGRGHAEFSSPKSVAVDSQSNLIVADDLNNRVQIVSKSGEFIHAFGRRGAENGEFDQPVGIAVNKNNEIIVCDYYNHRIQIF